MKTRKLVAALVTILSGSFTISAQTPDTMKLPQTWMADFTISLSYKNSMGASSTDLKFTYDSCIYVNKARYEGPVTKTYQMKEADRVSIIKKLYQLKADKIKSEDKMVPVRDGWSRSICIGSYCVEGGTSASMSDEDRQRFQELYDYLVEFAIKITR